MINENYVYWLAIILYFLQPGPYIKAVPLLILFATPHDNSWFMRIAFLFAGMGDFLLDGNNSVLLGTCLFGLTNLCLGIEFFLHNYFTLDTVSWVNIMSPYMIATWVSVCVLLFFLTPEYPLFSVYSLLMGFSLFQAFNLKYKSYTILFMSLFLVSDLLVLLQYTDIPNKLNELTVGVLHVTDLLMYWTAMFGICLTYNKK